MNTSDIFPSELQHKSKIVESRLNIKNHLNPEKIKKINGRKCNVSKIFSEQSSEFLNRTHIQGSAPASIHLGLFDDMLHLVSVMTFGKPRFSKDYEWELIRFASALNTIIHGGASKLFKYFIKNYKPNNIISYCDLRWNMGNVYEKCGMKLDHISSPCYWYVEPDGNISHRVQYQKHKLYKKLKIFDENRTEWENMQDNGYKRWFDKGNKIFVWENGQEENH